MNIAQAVCKKSNSKKEGKSCMKPIIVVENGEKYEYNGIEDMVKAILGEDYYNLPENEKISKLRLKTYMNATLRNLPIKDLTNGEKVEEIEKSQYIILDEITFLLSLAKNNDIVIYENENSEELANGIDKERLKRIAENYIRINDCANEILKNKIQANKIKAKCQDEDKKDHEERM